MALEAIRGRRTGIIYAATGSGKSHAQGAVLRALVRHPEWVDVVVVPTQDLVEQMRDDLSPWGLEVGRYYGRRKELAPVVAVCLPSVAALAEELFEANKKVRLAMVDECHRVGAASTTKAMEALGARLHMGWSATPIRTQNAAILRELWPDGILYGYSMADAIRDEAVVPPRVFRQQDEGTEDPNEATYALLMQHGEWPAVVDALDVEDAEFYAGWLRDKGIRAEHIHGGMGKVERLSLLGRLESGDLQALVHVRLLTEGVNLPWLRTLAMRAQTGSVIRYVQHMGRALRTHPGKTHGVIIDPHDLWGRFGLPSFSDDKWADRLEQALEKEATSGGGSGERILDEAVIVRDLEGWVAGLRERLLVSGVIKSQMVRGKGWRSEQPTEKQSACLDRWQDKRRSPGRYLPQAERDMWGQLLAMHGALSRGGVADMMDVGIGLSTVAREHKQRTGRWWGGLDRIGDG